MLYYTHKSDLYYYTIKIIKCFLMGLKHLKINEKFDQNYIVNSKYKYAIYFLKNFFICNYFFYLCILYIL